MEHLNNPNNNNNNNKQDNGGDKSGKRPVPADLDERSKLQKTSGFPPIQLGHRPYGININQYRSSGYQLGPKFPQNQQLPFNFPQNNLISNNNLHNRRVFPSYVPQEVLGLFQFPRPESNAGFVENSENPSSNNPVESSRQRENSEVPKHNDRKSCSCKKSRCMTFYCVCYANKKYCSVDCKCENCESTVENEHGVTASQKEVLLNNPEAFSPMIIGGEHKKGCTCKNTGCEKGYCVCKGNTVKCTSKCRCINCNNPFGARDYREVNTQAKQNNASASVPVGLHPLPQQLPVPVPIQCPNYGSMGNGENQQMHHASLPTNLETFLPSQPLHFPSNPYHPSIKNRVAYARMTQGLPGYSNVVHDSLFINNGSSRSRNDTLINENNETNHDLVPGDVHANATLNNQYLTPFSETLPNNISPKQQQQQHQQQQQQQHQQQQ